MKKRVKFLLIISLCLNIFLLGFVAGEIRHFKPKRESSGLVQEFMTAHQDSHQQLNKERKRALKMLKSDSFDEKAYAAQVEIVANLQNQLFKDFATETGHKLRAMPAPERNEIIDRLLKRRAGQDRRPRRQKP